MRFWMFGAMALVVAAPVLPPPGARAAAPDEQRGGQARQNSRVRSATGDALERYVGGDYDGAIAALVYLGGFSTVDADEWIRNGGVAEADRRRLIAASLALEVTAAKEAWPVTLIEWACESLRHAGPPTPNEALWMRASVALAEHDGMWAILGDTAHLGHALERFPDDPYFKLAQAFVAEAVASLPAVTTGTTTTDQTPVVFDRIAARVPAPGAVIDPKRLASLEKAAADFQAIVADPEVGFEASLRLGDVDLQLGRIDPAVAAFQKAALASRDPFVAYLARLFLAWTDARSGRTDDAIRGYRAALDLVPHARSASTLLAALMVTDGRLTDAEDVATSFLSAPSSVDDPWRMYPRGDFRNYLAMLARLHAAIKPAGGAPRNP